MRHNGGQVDTLVRALRIAARASTKIGCHSELGSCDKRCQKHWNTWPPSSSQKCSQWSGKLLPASMTQTFHMDSPERHCHSTSWYSAFNITPASSRSSRSDADRLDSPVSIVPLINWIPARGCRNTRISSWLSRFRNTTGHALATFCSNAGDQRPGKPAAKLRKQFG